MKRIHKTKRPSLRQIENMAANLRAKFGPYANIQTVTRSGDTKFWISNGEDFFGWLDSWKDLQIIYFELAKRRSYEKQ